MDYIPDVLYLQMDNCWRENKSQFVIIFLAVLVKKKVFKKVRRIKWPVSFEYGRFNDLVWLLIKLVQYINGKKNQKKLIRNWMREKFFMSSVPSKIEEDKEQKLLTQSRLSEIMGSWLL